MIFYLHSKCLPAAVSELLLRVAPARDVCDGGRPAHNCHKFVAAPQLFAEFLFEYILTLTPSADCRLPTADCELADALRASVHVHGLALTAIQGSLTQCQLLVVVVDVVAVGWVGHFWSRFDRCQLAADVLWFILLLICHEFSFLVHFLNACNL